MTRSLNVESKSTMLRSAEDSELTFFACFLLQSASNESTGRKAGEASSRSG